MDSVTVQAPSPCPLPLPPVSLNLSISPSCMPAHPCSHSLVMWYLQSCSNCALQTHKYTHKQGKYSKTHTRLLSAKAHCRPNEQSGLYEELKGTETHSRDLQFLAKWTSSSTSNIQVWTNGPTDTYCQCLPYMASTPSPNSLSSPTTTKQQHILRCVGCSEVSACCWEGSASSRGKQWCKVSLWHDKFCKYYSHIFHIPHMMFIWKKKNKSPDNVGPQSLSFKFINSICSHIKMTSLAADHFKCMLDQDEKRDGIL